MDKIDSVIMERLRDNSRTPFLTVSKELNVSEGTIRKRVKDLVNKGKIKRFTIESSSDTFAIVGVETETKTETNKIVKEIKQLGVGSIYEVTGRFDIICMIHFTEREKVNEMLEGIRSIEGVVHTETFTVLMKN